MTPSRFNPFRTFVTTHGRAACIAILFIGAPSFAIAQDSCSFGSDAAFDGLVKTLSHETSCGAAVEKLHNCAWGSSADAQFAPIVISKCEAAFFPKLSAQARDRYGEEMQLCAYEYARQQGTMYLSAAAMCQVDVAADYAAHPALAQLPAQRASFGCTQAQSTLDKAICSDTALGHADIVLSRVYQQTRSALRPPDTTFLIQNQKQWLQDLTATCGLSGTPSPQSVVACLRNQFELRFTALDECDQPDQTIQQCLQSPPDDIGPFTDEASVTSPRASFDCEEPSTALEIVICADADLGQTDIKLDHTYHAAIVAAPPSLHSNLIDSQRAWLRFVNRTCPLGAVGGIPPVLARSCVRTAFETRIAQVQACPLKPPHDQPSCFNDFALLQQK